MTAIFIIYQCAHFCGSSAAQPGAERPRNFQFSNAEKVSVQKKHGNINNKKVCNGKEFQVLANVSGVLAVQCLRKNDGHITPPADSLNYNITVEVPNRTSGDDSTDPNFGIDTLVEIAFGRDPNVTVTPKLDTTVIDVIGVTVKTQINIFT